MIFYGRKASRIKDGRISNVTCPDCDTQTSYDYSVFGKYAHIYWIPLFPMGKESVLECNNCKRTYKAGNLPENIRHKFNNEKQHAKTPLWNFAGLAVIAGLISLGAYWSGVEKKNQSKYAVAPLVGDVYSIETEKAGFYTSAKVTDLINDSIFIIYNDYEIDKRSKIYKIDKDENYSENKDAITKEELKNLFHDGTIYDIDRD